MRKLPWSPCLLAFAVCIGTLPAMAQTTFFTDLGTGSNVYQCCTGWTVSGGESSFTAANEFTAGASGSVSQIDIGVGYIAGPNSFFVALYTANGNSPGTLIDQWNNLSSNQAFGQCCGLVSITGITGVSLTAGDQYFLVIGPTNLTATTWESLELEQPGRHRTGSLCQLRLPEWKRQWLRVDLERHAESGRLRHPRQHRPDRSRAVIPALAGHRIGRRFR